MAIKEIIDEIKFYINVAKKGNIVEKIDAILAIITIRPVISLLAGIIVGFWIIEVLFITVVLAIGIWFWPYLRVLMERALGYNKRIYCPYCKKEFFDLPAIDGRYKCPKCKLWV
jgi:hypothetical protein